MNQFGDLYSQYYDLLYRDKDYTGEVEYVDGLIKSIIKNPNTLLDIGCGTGRHAEIFFDRGYTVHGIDISEDMIKIAEKRRKGKENRLFFSHCNVSDLNLNKKFDAVISLFHVLSYQNSNEDVINFFESAKIHLNEGGVFIFDFWYGPAVLTDLPTIRIKKLENDRIKITRIAEPVLHAQKNIVDVNYTLFIEDKTTRNIKELKEQHKMRYFFDTELELILEKCNLKLLDKYEWMTYKSPDFMSWNVVWIVIK